ncbi:nicotinate (nicotinamide) nucleotide adenylyltransferase [Buchnera aphidicola]|uniref:Probable nicotinate-nucleotide adenylyltransferase n=1 Tax=Buchnera aphidicola (Anoecia oenotherae) TaxID=1241833 RepID=A0A4D6Y0U6_9GAMM|nr:nicotinate (nicotinamide) nucleotide adenylyltransferase [Buchnera aphidicola]QCI19461.1 nicotinate (nicotinamide) nucleotide adenylyltransferase [Buchnera aphidicola (Anoecia oenotherae)]
MKKIISILGGTFNPIHNGHLLSAKRLLKEIHLQNIFLLPNNIPPHKLTLDIQNKHRLIMIKLAICSFSKLKMNLLEIKNKNISYTFETLVKIRQKIGTSISLIFIIGEDNLYEINRWENWKKFLNFCHIVVIPRKTKLVRKIHDSVLYWINTYTIDDISIFHYYSSGFIFFSNIKQENISSSKIRRYIKIKKEYKQFVPIKVYHYIKKNNLYLEL